MVFHTTGRSLARLATWPAALFIAGILLWYEQYKPTGNAGSLWLFTLLADWLHIHGYEKPFRLTVASAEIVAAVLIVFPFTRVVGAAFALAIMSGAIFSHVLSPPGIDPDGDGGALFKAACGVWIAAAFILFVYRDDALRLARGMVTPSRNERRLIRSRLSAP